MDAKICVDASFALKLVLPEADSDLAQSEYWLHSGVELTAPDLFTYETTSVLRNRVFRKEITQSEADEALEILGGLEITCCPFWTGDRRLYNAVKNRLKWVHVLGQ